MAAQHGIQVSDELWAQLQAKAKAEGKSAEELTAEALNQYLNREWLDRIEREGLERRGQYGLKTDDDVEQFVDQVISEHRRGR